MYKNTMVFIYLDMSGKSIYHLGQGYIAAYLREHHYQCELYVNDGMISISDMVDDLLEKDALCYGFCVYDTNYYLVKEITKRIRKKSKKKIYIIAGGPTATFSSEKVMSFDKNIDICIRHEGEQTTLKLVNRIYSETGYEDLEGISYRSNNGQLMHNEDVDTPEALDIFPSPILNGIIDPVDCQKKNNMVMLISSRGCVFNCRYCNFAAISRHCIRIHSIDRVMSEIKYIADAEKRSGIKFKIEFMDDIFTINRKRTIALCERILNENINFEFSIQTRADCMDTELISILYKAGCRRISFGLESAVPRILNLMGKVNTTDNNSYDKEIKYIEKMKEIVKSTKEQGMETTVNMILGWETETEEEGLHTLNVIDSLKVNRYAHNILVYYAGTEIYTKIRNKLENKISALEKHGEPVLNFNYGLFPEIYDYNPNKIPHLENDIYRYVMAHRRSIIQGIMGIGFEKKDPYQVIISFTEKLSYHWLLKNIALSSHIFFVNKLENSDEYIWYFPLKSFAGECLVNEGYTKIDMAESNKKVVKIVGKDAFENVNNKTSVIESHEYENYRDFIEKTEELSKNQLIKICASNNDDYMVEDYCRWGDEGHCTARSLSRLVINENEALCTCLNAYPLFENYKSFNKSEAELKIQEIYNYEYEIRGCVSCKISDSCSKCLYINEIGRENYCKMQQEKSKYKKLKALYKTKMMQYFYTP